MKKLKLTILGMHCASCVNNIQKSLSKINGVKSVSVSLLTHKAIIEAEDNVKIEELSKAISRVGYKLILTEEE